MKGLIGNSASYPVVTICIETISLKQFNWSNGNFAAKNCITKNEEH